MLELLARIAECLEARGVPYAICGSVAASLYAQPRSTMAIDLVAALTVADIEALAACFPEPEFFYDEVMAASAVTQPPHQFNILHMASGLKIDVYVPAADGAPVAQLERRRRVTVPGDGQLWALSPEDVILMKLVYYAEGHSDKHLSDCANLVAVLGQALDTAYLDEQSQRLGLAEAWLRVRANGERSG